MYYCFLEDKSFFPDKTIDLGNIDAPEAGYLGSNEEAYFYTKATILDPRKIRLQYNAKEIEGQVRLYFDQSKVEKEDEEGNELPDLFQNIKTEKREKLFELIERIYMDVDLATQTELDESLAEDSKYKDIYQEDSLILAKRRVSVISHQKDQELNLQVPEFIQFTYIYDPEQEDKKKIPYTFKIWLSREAFLSDYPLSTIIQVVLPCDHTYILNPSKFNSTIDAVIRSTEDSFAMVDARTDIGADIPKVLDISTTDTSGLFVYKTKYIVSSQSTVQLPFGILYKGHVPSTMEVRRAIKDKLLGYGTAPESVWESILPDLFVVGQFYIVPIWDNVTPRVDTNLYPSIIPYGKFKNIFSTLLPSLSANFISQHQEVFVTGQSEIFLTSMPDILNENETYSIYELHPTYQYHTSQDPAFAYQEDKTKEFNKKLNRCLAILFGESVLDGDIVETTIDLRKYCSFVASRIEYHVLTYESYVDLFMSD